jgi:serine phosphatase RsbU (regulator of sigma subunit)
MSRSSPRGRLIYISAGQNPPYLYDTNRQRTLDPTAVVLGMFDGMPFPEVSAELHAGSRLLLYTDGVTEAENRAGEQFGEGRLEAAIGGPGRSDPAGALDAIIAMVVQFRGVPRRSPARHHDDAREPRQLKPTDALHFYPYSWCGEVHVFLLLAPKL